MKLKTLTRWAALALSFVLLATACGGGDEFTTILDDFRERDASDVKPPEPVDAKMLAEPGLVLYANSPSWRRLLDAPTGKGAVVLFVLPGGPSDGRNIARGDLITAVDGDRVANQEHAVSLLRARDGDKKKLTIKGKNGKEREIEIAPKLPRRRARPYLDDLIKISPNDPVLLFLRSISTAAADEKDVTQKNFNDLNKALTLDARFGEAMSQRSAYLWSRRGSAKDAAQRKDVEQSALAGWRNALDIDPRNGVITATLANALVDIGQSEAGAAAAEKAFNLDGTQANASFALARARYNLKKIPQAAGPAAGAIELNRFANLNYYKLLAQIFVDLKRKDDCVKTAAAFVPYLKAHKSSPFEKAADDLEKICK